jgi:peptidoglycan/xylan/chitin deacetylase (PgdA/CDA1 family)
VLLTFDDGYSDFLTYAWPLLKRYGFTAMVFIVADRVGRTNSWDSVYGEEIPLLGWEDIRLLQDEGVEFGSHSVSHPFLTALSAEGIVREGARSRAILGRELGKMVKAFAYPYGDVDRVVQHCIGACGYIFGLTTRGYLSQFYDPLLALPRIEVCGSDRIKDFIRKLGAR